MTAQEIINTIKQDDLDFNGAIDLMTREDVGMDYLYSFDGMKELIKHELDEEDMNMVQHLVNAVWNDKGDGDEWWVYDRSLGTLVTPYSVNSISEIIEYLEEFI